MLVMPRTDGKQLPLPEVVLVYEALGSENSLAMRARSNQLLGGGGKFSQHLLSPQGLT